MPRKSSILGYACGAKIKYFFLFFLFLFLIPVFYVSGEATLAKGEETEYENKLNESVLEQIGKLDLKELQSYVDSLGAFENESVAERLYAQLTSSDLNYSGIFSRFSDVLFTNVRKLLPSFLCMASVALLCGIVTTLKSGTLSTATDRAIFLSSYLAVLIPVITVVTECFLSAKESVEGMKTQMQIVFPLLLTLMAASGGTLTAAICRPAVSFLSTTIVTMISGVVFPITLTIIAFSMASNLSTDLKLGKFTAFFKSINKWLIGISVSVFGLFFTLQGITAASYDGITRRAAKYAIGTGVPIVGGFLSGGFDLAVAGSALIKNALGGMSVFLMLTVVFEPLIMLVSANVLFRLTAAITQPFGDGRISDFLGETADNLNYCTAGLLFTAFLYFLCIVLIVCTSEAFF